MPTLYLFGIVPASCDIDPASIEIGLLPGLRLSRIDHGTFAAMVAEVPEIMLPYLETVIENPETLPELLVTHDRTIQAIFRNVPILPCRFGTVLAGPEALVRWLDEQAEALHQGLNRVRESGEWSIKLIERQDKAQKQTVTP